MLKHFQCMNYLCQISISKQYIPVVLLNQFAKLMWASMTIYLLPLPISPQRDGESLLALDLSLRAFQDSDGVEWEITPPIFKLRGAGGGSPQTHINVRTVWKAFCFPSLSHAMQHCGQLSLTVCVSSVNSFPFSLPKKKGEENSPELTQGVRG